MKKAIESLFAILFVILTVSGVSATEKIKLVDNYIAIFDFEVTTGDKGISRPLTDSTIHEFSKSDKYDVIDRGNMNKILKEQKFQMSGCVAQECKVEAGQLLGVGKIVSGSVGLLGKTYFLVLQLINVQTGKVELSATDECKCEIDELIGSTRRLVKKLLGEQIVQLAAEVEQAARAKAESDVKARAELIAKVQIEAEAKAKAKAEEEAEAKAKLETKIRAEEVAKAKAVAEAKARLEDEVKVRAEAEARAKAEEAERIKAEQIAKERAEEIEKLKAEIARAKAEEEKRTKVAEAESATKAEAEANNHFEKLSYGIVRDTSTGLDWYAGPDKDTTWDDARSWAENLNIEGRGWRMPTISELKSLYRKGVGSRNMTPLLETTGWWVWSSETGWGWGFQARALDFDRGSEILDRRVNSNFHRGFAVRYSSKTSAAVIALPTNPVKETAKDGYFIAYDNETVLDTQTNLMWAANDNGNNINWSSAKSYCENYQGGGYTDWRMPTTNELEGLFNTAYSYNPDCGHDVHLTELIRLTCLWVWASETRGSEAISFDFRNGVSNWGNKSFGNDGFRVIPVRSVK